jgi:hypothetical protein
MKKWQSLKYKNYSAVCIFNGSNWEGDFNFPARRFALGFVGKTTAQANEQFRRGVDMYLKHMQQMQLMPEAEGMQGVAELLALESRASQWERQLLHWPTCPDEFKNAIGDVASRSLFAIQYQQAALDEFCAILDANPKITTEEVQKWAFRVFKEGELERTTAGFSIARHRANQMKDQNHV